MKTAMKLIAVAAQNVADQANAVAESETNTDHNVAVVRRAFLSLNSACDVLRRKKK